MSNMRIVFIGSGNTATVLARRMREQHHAIVQVFNRTEQKAKALALSLGCAYTNNPEQITREADLYILAISDNALADVATWFPSFKQLVVHTAGSVSKEVLQPVAANYGV